MGKMRAGSLADLVHMAHEAGLSADESSLLASSMATTEMGPGSDSFLVGASDLFAGEPAVNPAALGVPPWGWSRTPRSSRSSGSS